MIKELVLLKNIRDSIAALQVKSPNILVATLRIKSLLLQRIKEAQKHDAQFQKLIEEGKKRKKFDFYISDEDIIKFRNRLCIPNDMNIKNDILKETHCSGYSIHPDRDVP